MYHRNSQKRIYLEGYAYFVTSVTYNRYPYFQNPFFAEICVLDLWFAVELKQIELFGYTVLPDHVHILFHPTGVKHYSQFIAALKRNTARDINDLIGGRSFIRTLNATRSNDANHRLQANYEITKQKHPHLTFQSYQRHFERLGNVQQRFLRASRRDSLMQKFRWQKSFRDHVIRDERDFRNHVNYILGNAVKHDLVDEPEEWRWMWVMGMSEPNFAGEHSNVRLRGYTKNAR